jgi:hypothetical protein
MWVTQQDLIQRLNEFQEQEEKKRWWTYPHYEDVPRVLVLHDKHCVPKPKRKRGSISYWRLLRLYLLEILPCLPTVIWREIVEYYLEEISMRNFTLEIGISIPYAPIVESLTGLELPSPPESTKGSSQNAMLK